MANYRRLISYIYEYEDGVKGNNTGFAKLESRSGQCKIQVNVKKVYMGNQDYVVYLLAESGEVPLGKIFLRNGAGDFRGMVSSGNVAGSGLPLESFYGLTLHGAEDSWRSYTTIWEDAVAHAAEVDLSDATAEAVEARQMRELPGTEITENHLSQLSQEQNPSEMENLEEEIQNQEIKEVPDVSEEGFQPAALNAAEPAQETVTPGVLSMAVMSTADSGREASAESSAETSIEMPESTLESAPGAVSEASPESEMAMETAEIPDLPTAVPNQEDTGFRLPPMGVRSHEEPPQPPVSPWPHPVQATQPQGISMEAQTSTSQPQDFRPQLQIQQPEEEDTNLVKLWMFLNRTYPKIQAFDYQGECEVLTIKPQDIGLLPRETWGYGNNSFLLHGYYNHRYLILARLRNADGSYRFLLGVPGHYYSNEKYMAAMFGFPNFVLSKMQPAGEGRFGYWYSDIHLGAS